LSAPEFEGGKWRPEELPLLPQFKLRVAEAGKEQFAVLAELMTQADELVNACDAGREGELIFRYLCEAAGCEKPMLRLWISSLTSESIKQGFQNLRPGGDFDCLFLAGRCRSQADWLVGINATRAYTIIQGSLYSVGRVQTPTLAFLVEREKEIQQFKAQTYWLLRAVFDSPYGSVPVKYAGDQEGKILSETEAKRLVAQVEGSPATVVQFEDKETLQPPALPFDLTALQQESNERWGWTAAHTLEVAQNLYEKRKLITYPRTSSRYVTPDLVKTFGARLRAIVQAKELNFKPVVSGLPGFPQFNPPPSAQRPIVDEQKVTDHHAILPTEITAPDGLAGDEGQLYRLIASSFLALFLPPCRFAERSLTVECAGSIFTAKSKQMEDAGWRALPLFSKTKPGQGAAAEAGAKSRRAKAGAAAAAGAATAAGAADSEAADEDMDNLQIPLLKVGETGSIKQAELRKEKTRPPRRYTEAALLSAMKNAGRRVEDPELPGGDVGLGTPATRAAILERLKKVGYVTVQGKNLIPTPKGMTLLEVLNVPELKVPDLTVKLENQLREIETGKREAQEFMQEIEVFTQRLVQEALQAKRRITLRPGETAVGNCPLCGQPIRDLPKSYGCLGYQDGCKFVIWKEQAGKKITLAQAKRIIAKGESLVIKGFVNWRGEKFNGRLKLNAEGRVILERVNTEG
jgi:DNA topoisomerase-3